MKRVILYTILCMLFGTAALWAETEEPKLGDKTDGSRAVPNHLVPLYDEQGSQIFLDDSPVLPFSTKETCLPCHDYDIISHGWHFNAPDSGVRPGRPGHPWIYTDRVTGTQIPLHHRDWEGVYDPAAIGLTPFYFLQEFGRQFPGGGVGEIDSADISKDLFFRWQVSGRAEVNCLACHDVEPAQDQSEYDKQMLKQNFRWAAAATAGFATVEGSAKDMQDTYDIYSQVGPGPAEAVPPRIKYDEHRFDDKDQVFIDIRRDIPNRQCYFCHSSRYIESPDKEEWETDEDVHLTSGMMCVDCHRNGLDHMMVRGYANEAKETNRPNIASFSCEGCHVGEKDKRPEHGRLGAPKPAHLGIPTIHFEKMSCTSCHSGPWPQKETMHVQTSIAHGLGTHNVIKGDSVMPYIASPVYARAQDHKITPHNLIFPTFWGVENDGEIQPVPPDDFQDVVIAAIQADTLTDSLNFVSINTGEWPTLSKSQFAMILDSLSVMKDTANTVFVGGGKVHRLLDGNVVSEKHPAAEPYKWPFAHNVRSAEQSLGGKSCNDCHSLGAGFNFGNVKAASPLGFQTTARRSMTSYQETGKFYQSLFAFTFYFRPLLKIFIDICLILMTAVFLLYVFKGLDAIVQHAFESRD